MKGRTRWYPRHVHPVRNGTYECIARIAPRVNVRWQLEWDGKGFLVPFPMAVHWWRGMTKAAHRAASKGGGNDRN